MPRRIIPNEAHAAGQPRLEVYGTAAVLNSRPVAPQDLALGVEGQAMPIHPPAPAVGHGHRFFDLPNGASHPCHDLVFLASQPPARMG